MAEAAKVVVAVLVVLVLFYLHFYLALVLESFLSLSSYAIAWARLTFFHQALAFYLCLSCSSLSAFPFLPFPFFAVVFGYPGPEHPCAHG